MKKLMIYLPTILMAVSMFTCGFSLGTTYQRRQDYERLNKCNETLMQAESSLKEARTHMRDAKKVYEAASELIREAEKKCGKKGV